MRRKTSTNRLNSSQSGLQDSLVNQPESKPLFNHHEYLEKSCKVMKINWPKSGNPVVTFKLTAQLSHEHFKC